jgi:hypothetical protein
MRACPRAAETKKPPWQDATPEARREPVRANGMAKTALIQYTGYRWDNRYAAAAVKRHPQHLQAVARGKPQSAAAPDGRYAVSARRTTVSM